MYVKPYYLYLHYCTNLMFFYWEFVLLIIEGYLHYVLLLLHKS